MDISTETATHPRPAAREGRRLLPRIVCAAALLFCADALAQGPRPDPQPPTKPPAASGAPAAKPHERLSKFEARRIRQACRDRANERGAKGQEREAFLTRCYFGRVSHRGLRRECAQQAAAKGLTDKTAARDFIKECVKERAKP